MNGVALGESAVAERLTDLRVTTDGSAVVSGGVLGTVALRSLADLSILYRTRLDSAVACIVPSDRFLCAGLSSGSMNILLPVYSNESASVNNVNSVNNNVNSVNTTNNSAVRDDNK